MAGESVHGRRATRNTAWGGLLADLTHKGIDLCVKLMKFRRISGLRETNAALQEHLKELLILRARFNGNFLRADSSLHLLECALLHGILDVFITLRRPGPGTDQRTGNATRTASAL